MKNIFYILIVVILFGGCSSREYFTPNPKKVEKPIYFDKEMNNTIIFFTRKVATLDNYTLLPSNKKIPKGFLALSNDLSKNGTILRVDGKNIKFDKLIVTASKKGNLLAILFGDNHFELYDLKQHKTISSLSFDRFVAIRKFIASPYFYKDLLLIPTLDGKLVIYDLKQQKMIRSIIVSDKDYFNNIIYLGVKNDNLIVASRDNLIIISPTMVINNKYNIKHILVTDDYIYLFTIEGKVIKLNFDLKVLKEKNFKYANILAPMIYDNNIYFLSRGNKSYLIKLNKSLDDYSVTPLKVKIDEDERLCNEKVEKLYLKTNIFSKNGIFYIGDYKLKVK